MNKAITHTYKNGDLILYAGGVEQVIGDVHLRMAFHDKLDPSYQCYYITNKHPNGLWDNFIEGSIPLPRSSQDGPELGDYENLINKVSVDMKFNMRLFLEGILAKSFDDLTEGEWECLKENSQVLLKELVNV